MSTLTDGQTKALDLALSGKNLFITGKAGTGKSYLTKKIYEELLLQGKQVALTASTGTAALNVADITGFDASTTHSFLGIPLGDNKVIQLDGNERWRFKIPKKKLNLLKAVDVLIIDEISMLRLDAFGRAMTILAKVERQTGKKIQVILIGDFLQLPPVVTQRDRQGLSKFYNTNEMYAFDATKYQAANFDITNVSTYPVWNQVGFDMVELTEIVRQADEEFADNLSAIRIGDTSRIDYFNNHAHFGELPDDIVQLFPLKKDVERVNNQKLNELLEQGAELETYHARMHGTVTDRDIVQIPEDETLNLAVGARVRITVNSPGASPKQYIGKEKYVNGSLGTYLGLDDEYMQVVLDNGELVHLQKIDREIYGSWYSEQNEDGEDVLKRDVVGVFTQYPLVLSFAATIHRSQGITIDKVFISPSKIFTTGQLYVALSRLTDIDGLYLDSPITSSVVKCDERVRDYVYEFRV